MQIKLIGTITTSKFVAVLPTCQNKKITTYKLSKLGIFKHEFSKFSFLDISSAVGFKWRAQGHIFSNKAVLRKSKELVILIKDLLRTLLSIIEMQ